jgi:hypothetical protein
MADSNDMKKDAAADAAKAGKENEAAATQDDADELQEKADGAADAAKSA